MDRFRSPAMSASFALLPAMSDERQHAPGTALHGLDRERLLGVRLGLRYEPGDALGTLSRNPDALVAEVIDTPGLDATGTATIGNDARPLHASQMKSSRSTTCSSATRRGGSRARSACSSASASATTTAALQVAQSAQPGGVILTVLPDTGERYLSSLRLKASTRGLTMHGWPRWRAKRGMRL